jgi:hypothetical protein
VEEPSTASIADIALLIRLRRENSRSFLNR